MLTPGFALVQSGTISRWLRRGVSADEYAEPHAVRCRVNFRQKLAYGGKQNETVAIGTVFFPAGTQVAAGDRFTFNGTTYAVLTSQPCYDLRGIENHVEADIQ